MSLHIIQFPSGRWGYVGRVPVNLATAIPATTQAVLGCRAWRNEAGDIMEWKFPTFDTAADAVTFAQGKGHAPMLENVPQHA